MWKLANITPVVKKGDTQLIKNYRPISLLPICGKTSKQLFSTIFTNILYYTYTNHITTHHLISKKQSGF